VIVPHAASAGRVRLMVDRDVLWAEIDHVEARNAINSSVLSGLEHMIDLARLRRVKVVVIRGAGGTFCSGADLNELKSMRGDRAALSAFMGRLGSVLETLVSAPWVSVAVVEGHAVAGGCELLLASDIVIAAANAQIGDGHVAYGLAPAAGASIRLPRAVTPALARYLLLTGDMVTGEEAERKGLVTLSVPPEKVEVELRRVVARVSSRGRATLRTIKAMLATSGDDLRPLLHRELDLFLDHMANAPDPERGLAAFQRRQTPSFEDLAGPPNGSDPSPRQPG
jgi:enoyl-CoA hydratase